MYIQVKQKVSRQDGSLGVMIYIYILAWIIITLNCLKNGSLVIFSSFFF